MGMSVGDSSSGWAGSRRGARLGLAGLVSVLVVCALPAVANAATIAAKVSNITITPSLTAHAGFGLYHFDVSPISSGDTIPFPFAGGSKIGHCVEANIMINSDTGTLRSGDDLSLANNDGANTLGTGLTPGAQRVEWILLDSYKNSPGDATGVEAAAHQSAIWSLTNPSSPNSTTITGSSANELAAAARAAQLVGDSATNYASVLNAANLSVDGGADLHTCSGTSRTITITGSPFTEATLTLTGSGHFDTTGTTSATVDLGPTGTTQVQVDSTGPGQIDVNATIQIATMVQADNGGNQDFVYLEFQPVQKQVSIVFNDCQNLQLAKTATPSFVRSYDWTIAKSVDQTSVTTSSDTATFVYTVVANKSAATDSGWKVTGTISVTNPTATPVDNVQVGEQGTTNGGVCAVTGTGALGTLAPGASGSVAYTCTYAAAPTSATGVNTALVSWTMPGSGDPPVTHTGSVAQTFTFGAPATISHDSVNVTDAFDGGPAVTVDGGANLTASGSFTYGRTVAVPATACRVYDNTASVTAVDTPSYSKTATATVQACRQAPPSPPVKIVGTPTHTTIKLSKHASSPTVKAGGTVAFTITWTNTGPVAAKHVLICDRLPDELTFVSAKGASYKNGKACWSKQSVRKGATLTFRVVARADATVGNKKLVNVATATASNAKPATAKAPVRAVRKAGTRPAGVTG
jgi:uncharacterized repeat protein (TIGR01451 family)